MIKIVSLEYVLKLEIIVLFLGDSYDLLHSLMILLFLISLIRLIIMSAISTFYFKYI